MPPLVQTPHDAHRNAVKDEFVAYGGYESSQKTSSKSSFIMTEPIMIPEDDRQERFETALQ